MRPTVYCVLRSGGDYRPEHVERLRQQLVDCRLECITDDVSLVSFGVGFIHMKHDYPGWWSKLELCRPDIPGDVFYMDLDTTVLGPIAHLATIGKTTFLSDFYRPENLQSSLMWLSESMRAKIWAAWSMSPLRSEMIMALYGARRVGFNGDQNFIQDVIGPNVARWQNEFPGEVVSYKCNVLPAGRIPPFARVIINHGKPRPWECGL